MMKTLYIVRHCEAEGQEADAPLTTNGLIQAEHLAQFLAEARIEHIVSSPYVRARDSIAPLAERLKIDVEIDERLIERVLCRGSIPDWRQHLEASFLDLDLCLEGGESSRTAMQRVVSVVQEIERHSAQITLLATHGNLLALLLKHFDDSVGFSEWQNLNNPDVFRVSLTQCPQIQRLNLF